MFPVEYLEIFPVEYLELSVRVGDALSRVGLTEAFGLVAMSDAEILAIPHVGPKGLREIRQVCAEAGLHTLPGPGQVRVVLAVRNARGYDRIRALCVRAFVADALGMLPSTVDRYRMPWTPAHDKPKAERLREQRLARLTTALGASATDDEKAVVDRIAAETDVNHNEVANFLANHRGRS